MESAYDSNDSERCALCSTINTDTYKHNWIQTSALHVSIYIPFGTYKTVTDVYSGVQKIQRKDKDIAMLFKVYRMSAYTLNMVQKN